MFFILYFSNRNVWYSIKRISIVEKLNFTSDLKHCILRFMSDGLFAYVSSDCFQLRETQLLLLTFKVLVKTFFPARNIVYNYLRDCEIIASAIYFFSN